MIKIDKALRFAEWIASEKDNYTWNGKLWEEWTGHDDLNYYTTQELYEKFIAWEQLHQNPPANEDCEHRSSSSWGDLVTCLDCGYRWIKED